MIANYFKIAVRVLRRAKLYSFITIAGLALGLAAAILIGLWIHYQFSFDTYNANAGRTYRVTTHFKMGEFGQTMATSAPPIEEALKNLPAVQAATALKFSTSKVIVSYGKQEFVRDKLAYGDSQFFKVFSIPVVEGNPSTMLSAPNTIVLAKSLAQLLFGGTDPIGKVVKVTEGSEEKSFQVTGVMDDVPSNSHFHFSMLASLSTYYKDHRGFNSQWFYNTNYNYFVVRPDVPVANVAKQLSAAVERNLGKSFVGKYSWGIGVQKLTDIHLHSHLSMEIEPNGSMQRVMIFLVIGLFILLIAIVNFVSLSTAKYADRVKEIGIRKVIGADRRLLFFQFTGEGVVLTLLAAVLAVSIAEIALPYFNAFTGSSLTMGPGEMAAILAGSMVIGILAGSYPAFFLSSFRIGRILKRDLSPGQGNGFFRKGLVVTQFVIAIGIMVSTIVIARQLHFVESRYPGFDGRDVVVIPSYHHELDAGYPQLKNEFMTIPGVVDVSASGGEFGSAGWNNQLEYNGNVLFKSNWLGVNYGFIKTMKMQLVSGRSFSQTIASDTTGAIIVNQSAAERLRKLGLVGKTLYPGVATIGASALHVIGVVKDFNYLSMYNPVKPFFFVLMPRFVSYVYVRISSRDVAETLRGMRAAWHKIAPEYPFEYHFLDRQLNASYIADRNLGRAFGIAALLSVFISVIGMFGLANYTIERRVKEVGIRKALGATVADVTILLSKEFAVLVAAANVVAWPIAYYFGSRWLQNFAYHVGLEPLTFIGAGVAVFVVAIGTVALRAIKAAHADPIESLRYE